MKQCVLVAIAVAQVSLFAGCASAFKSSTYVDDLYTIHNKTEIANRQKAEAELAKAQAEARQAQLEAAIAEANANAVVSNDYTTYESYNSVLADTYESAYARRLYGFESPSYRMPSSYYSLYYSNAFNYATAYDPAFYNVMVSGDQVWVEPKYITSMFGTWGASVVVPSYGWYTGWMTPYSYAWWGYPRYSWYDWNYGIGLNPWWGYAGLGWGRPHHPVHYPIHNGGVSWNHRRGNVVHRPSYSRPSSAGSSVSTNGSVRRGGTTTGSGVYKGGSSNSRGSQSSGQYRGNSNSNRNDNNSYRQNSSSSNNRSSGSSYSGGYSGGGNSSGSSHGGGQHRR